LDFYDVKADLMGVLALTGSLDEFRFEPASLGCLRPGRTARIFRGATPLGWLGEVHPQLVKVLGLPPNAILFELEIESAFAAKSLQFKRISRFPSVRRDLGHHQSMKASRSQFCGKMLLLARRAY
jgi:phenylalanyl-tRNA synthetase beta chain